MSLSAPIPANEINRIIELSEFDLDYASLDDQFKELTKLAAKIAGTEISLINLIDSFTQWSVSNYGLDLQQMPREDSVCQYTIVTENFFEVKDLSADERFKDKFYVKDDPNLRYYFGVPLSTNNGIQLGALCVLDTIGKEISPEKVEMLKIIADEIVNRLMVIRVINSLQNRVKEVKETQKKVAHDIRGPLSGIVGLAQIISEQGNENKLDEVLQLVSMIQKGGHSLLELADEILSAEKKQNSSVQLGANEYDLQTFKEKLEKLFAPQAVNKNITLSIIADTKTDDIPFSKNKLLQIAGNLISNAIKFTPATGTIKVELSIRITREKHLTIRVTDSGSGMDAATVQEILHGEVMSSEGTGGEKGYGFGLQLVKHLVQKLGGTMNIESELHKGSLFEIKIPI
ncbi:GAF domain-containing sensor histidine kinase [Sediminibacterium goheungense]|uniref:histidine kinase n=1 Tax=Sediminibacterium goheungense TaxID=1086393 RepID=A0A4R6J1Q0_9BACT|nr:GAF domain-containing sensor histidine kinase [Sediminibacterium goheungense]TDO29179.1 signal transduction histidine kinase [Sediminibacterium goheungense]